MGKGGLLSGGFSLDFAFKGEGRDGMDDGKGKAAFAWRGEAIDANLFVGEGLEILSLHRENLDISEARIPMIHHGFDPYTSHRTTPTRKEGDRPLCSPKSAPPSPAQLFKRGHNTMKEARPIFLFIALIAKLRNSPFFFFFFLASS